MTDTPSPLPEPLPLFPLQCVLFPGALLSLRVFEARYLDLIGECLRQQQPFGVVCLRQGAEAGGDRADVRFDTTGALAHVDEVDADQAGILRVRCTGGQRFRLRGQATQRADGLWQCTAEAIAPDALRLPGPAMLGTVNALADAIRKLQQQDRLPFAAPFRLDDAGWVANRWCELLPVPLELKQRLMQLDNPLVRLELVGDVLERTGIAPL